jgi:hypothetical protein
MAMSDNEKHKEYVSKYRRRDLGNGGKQEPGDTLMSKRHISIFVRELNRLDSTCVRSRRPKPNKVPLKCRRNKPRSMMRSKIMSVTRLERILYLLLSVSST